jgi:hypothetical protein
MLANMQRTGFLDISRKLVSNSKLCVHYCMRQTYVNSASIASILAYFPYAVKRVGLCDHPALSVCLSLRMQPYSLQSLNLLILYIL